MKLSTLVKFVPPFLALLGFLLLACWLLRTPRLAALVRRVPGMDRLGPMLQEAPVNMAGVFTQSDGKAAKLPGAWPGFRGAHGDGVSTEKVTLASSWSAQGPPVRWSLNMGEGYAGAAVLHGRVYLLDYRQKERQDVVRCLSLADGKEIWNRAYPVKVKRNHGMSRTVPAVTDKYLVTLGPKCHVLCLDSVSGAFHWGLDLVRKYHTRVPPWYAGQCPLIDNGKAILAPGGDALLVAIDCATGKELWRTPNPNGWAMSHASLTTMTIHGKRMYVYCAAGGVAGISPADGKLLWDTDQWKVSIATIPTPIDVGGGRLFLCGGYGSGSMMLSVTEQNGRFTVKPLFRLKPEVFGSDQQTPILYHGNLYGVKAGGELVCLDLQGHTLWKSGSTHRFGLGPYIIADGKILVINDTGTLTMAAASPDSYQQLAQARVLNGQDSWAPLAIAGGLLLARDLTRMVCLDLK